MAIRPSILALLAGLLLAACARENQDATTVPAIATTSPVEATTASPADRKAFAALIAPVAKDKTLGGVATFKLLASREEHGPLVESRVPLKDYPRVVALLHARR